MIKILKILACISALGWLLFFSSCFSEVEPGLSTTVSGTITELRTGNPLSGVTVEVEATRPGSPLSRDSFIVEELTTGPDGRFHFQFVTEEDVHSYSLRYFKESYRCEDDLNWTCDAGIEPGEEVNLDLKLRAIATVIVTSINTPPVNPDDSLFIFVSNVAPSCYLPEFCQSIATGIETREHYFEVFGNESFKLSWVTKNESGIDSLESGFMIFDTGTLEVDLEY